MRFRRSIGAAVAAAGLVTSVAACTPAAVDGKGSRPPCPAVFFGVAGSGEGPAFPAPAEVPHGTSRQDARNFGPLIAELKNAVTGLAGNGLAAAHAVDYPATTAPHWLGHNGLSGLDISESTGARRLVAAVHRSYRLGCRQRPVLLAGYSQGAEVVTEAVDSLTPRQRRSVTVALFGNPSFEPRRPGDVPADSPYAGLRPTYLDGSAKLLPAAVRARTIDVCAPGDPVCGVPGSLLGTLGTIPWVLDHMSVHSTAYLGSGWVERAARFLWRHRVPMR